MRRSFYHLTRGERDVILEGIATNTPLSDIAASLGKNPTSISREVKNYRSYEGSGNPSTPTLCTHWEKCEVRNLCTSPCEKRKCRSCTRYSCAALCTNFEQKACARTTRWPHVCNGCLTATQRRCRLVKWRYYPSIATVKADKQRSQSRQGISFNATELVTLDEKITPLIRENKLSVEAALKVCKDINVSPSTLRRWIDSGNTSVIRLDLLSAPSRKVRKKRQVIKSRHTDDGRSFDDFERLSKDIKKQAWEIDTVQGAKRDTCRLMTLCHRDSNFLFIFKIAQNTQECVVGILDYLDVLCFDAGHEFSEIFSVLLADNGAEFGDSEGIEESCVTDGDKRCSLYYCDPYSSWQKPYVESAHTFIRRVLPKGVSFESLTHKQVAKLCSHINSYPRASKDKTPFEQILEVVPPHLLSELGIESILPMEVALRQDLLDF